MKKQNIYMAAIFTAVLFITIMCLVFFPRHRSNKEISRLNDYLMEKAVPYTDMLTLCNIYPHDTEAFTEGLSCYEGMIYESTGRYGHSVLNAHDLKKEKSRTLAKLPETEFGEGSVIWNDTVFLLTYRENTAYKGELTQDGVFLQSYKYPQREGWGLTTDGTTHLIASDGSSNLYIMTDEFRDIRKIPVTLDEIPIWNINELEYIDGKIWANIWHTNIIVIIDPDSGKIEKCLDFSDMIETYITTEVDTLNGIAFYNGNVFITGKYYPCILEFRLK